MSYLALHLLKFLKKVIQTLRRSERISRPPDRSHYGTYTAVQKVEEPQNFVEAVNCNEKELWLQAIIDEMSSYKRTIPEISW